MEGEKEKFRDTTEGSGEQPAQGSSQLGHRGGAGLKLPGKGY